MKITNCKSKIINLLQTVLAMLMATFSCSESCYLRAVEVQVGMRTKVTAYCPCEKCCGKYADGITASGHKIQKGDKFCAAPANIPFCTMLIIPGYNNNEPVPVLDRGGSITEGRLDVFFDEHDEALQWGVQYLEIKQGNSDE
ncbi:MAG: 3D domain-containing protein [Phycisphaerae bacterium]|nr:3D domain-containing protein [Phycisphaerae bacterium]